MAVSVALAGECSMDINLTPFIVKEGESEVIKSLYTVKANHFQKLTPYYEGGFCKSLFPLFFLMVVVMLAPVALGNMKPKPIATNRDPGVNQPWRPVLEFM